MEVTENDLSYGMTGFIDILGFSAKVLAAKKAKDLADLCNYINTIQDSFEFSNKNDVTTENHKLSGKQILAFSDCLVFHVPLTSEMTEHTGEFETIMMGLVNLAFSQAWCVNENLFIRGGLDIGWWYNQENRLISNALVTAAKREESANVPVIALCDNLYKYLEAHENRNTYSKESDPIFKMFSLYEDEKESFYFLDYIYLCLNNMDPHPTNEEKTAYEEASGAEKYEIYQKIEQRTSDDWLKAHAKSIEEAANDVSDNPKLYSKYVWLAEYHNKTLEGFTSNSECVCKVPEITRKG
ncbi:hypothetical protein [Pseudoalteromonas maricaloris]|uniref:hypothetical protein n=1 Tax=Pseudoalteromonas maricaloris TaxID=184924 RepID=UPI00029A79AE|nr:hypothetical protein [Pseudoalteromonas flavipulchra]